MTPARKTRSPVGAGPLLCAPALLFLAAFFIGPLVLNLSRSLGGAGGWPSLAQYARALGDAYYLEVLANTLLLAGAVTGACLVMGYPIALAIARAQGPLKSALIFLVVTPLLINVVVRTFGWMVVLGQSGFVNALIRGIGLPSVEINSGWFAIGITLVHVLLPFMVLSIASALEGIDPLLEQAATTLGASPWRAFIHVVWPLSLEGVITGVMLVFALTVGSFVTVMLMGDNATMVLPLLIYQQLTVASDWPFAAALGTILLAIVVAATYMQLRLTARRRVS